MSPILDKTGRPFELPAKPAGRPLPVSGGRDLIDIWPRQLTPRNVERARNAANGGNVSDWMRLSQLMIETDAHLLGEHDKRVSAVTILPWNIQPAGTSTADVDLANEVEQQLKANGVTNVIAQLMSATAKGFAAQEVYWETSERQWRPWLKERDQAEFTFAPTDYKSGLLSFPRLITPEDYQGREVDPYQIILYANHRRSGHICRHGYMRSIARWSLICRYDAADWATFAHKYGMPMGLATYPAGTKQDDINTLVAQLKRLIADGVAALPDGTTFKLESGTRAWSPAIFRELLKHGEKKISIAVLGQTLTADVGDRGSFAAATVHNEVRHDLTIGDALSLADCINNQLIRPYVHFNHGPDRPCPSLTFEFPDQFDEEREAKVLVTLAGAGVQIPQSYVHRRFNIPLPQGDEPVLVPPGRQTPPADAEDAAKTSAKAGRAKLSADEAGDDDLAPEQPALDSLAEAGAEQAAGIVAPWGAKLLTVFDKATDLRAARNLLVPTAKEINIVPLEDAVVSVLVGAHLTGRQTVLDEIAALAKVAASADSDTRYLMEPLPPEEAIEFWRRKLQLSPIQFYELESELRSVAFSVAGVTRMDMVHGLYEAIGEAISEGTTLAAFKKSAAEIFESLGWAESKPWRIENAFRTNVQSAYSAGRYKQMNDPAVAAERPLWQYLAVNDGRTRPAHSAMHGRIYHKDNRIWDTWMTPNGYRCRCKIRCLSMAEVREFGLADKVNVPIGDLMPDEGWDHNPALQAWSPDLDRYPAEIRALMDDHGPGVI